eukprot:PhM_4_TR9511/c0_g1_i1/m.74087/K00472/P4HA; prolyl 4-hydroxylase
MAGAARRMPWRIVVFALICLLLFVAYNFRGHTYDPNWHLDVHGPKQKNNNNENNNKKQNIVQDSAKTSSSSQSLMKGLQVPKGFRPVQGVHYVADYNISDLLPLEDLGPKRRFEYHHCQKPHCFILSYRPMVMYFPEFMSDEECDAIIAAAKPKMFRSEVSLYKEHKAGESPVQDVRTSTQAWLDPAYVPEVAAIRARIQQITSINDGELLQVLHYGIGQKYDAHNDYFDPVMYGPQTTNRAVTHFLYLNTVEEGGETWFPRANGGEASWEYRSCSRGLRVHPRKRSMAIFYDMKANGDLDPYSLHGGCPVKKGEKWGGTQWMRVKTSP